MRRATAAAERSRALPIAAEAKRRADGPTPARFTHRHRTPEAMTPPPTRPHRRGLRPSLRSARTPLDGWCSRFRAFHKGYQVETGLCPVPQIRRGPPRPAIPPHERPQEAPQSRQTHRGERRPTGSASAARTATQAQPQAITSAPRATPVAPTDAAQRGSARATPSGRSDPHDDTRRPKRDQAQAGHRPPAPRPPRTRRRCSSSAARASSPSSPSSPSQASRRTPRRARRADLRGEPPRHPAEPRPPPSRRRILAQLRPPRADRRAMHER